MFVLKLLDDAPSRIVAPLQLPIRRVGADEPTEWVSSPVERWSFLLPYSR
jgi:hypothetical protein